MNIAIVGAGGLGSYIGAVLSRSGHDVSLVARGEHAAAIERDGLHIRSHEGDFTVQPRVVASAFELDSVDLAFVVVKTFSLDEVAPQLAHVVGQGAVVTSLLNGVTAADRLAAHGIAPGQIVDGVAYMTAFRVAPGTIERKAAHQRIVAGSAGGAPVTDVVEQAFPRYTRGCLPGFGYRRGPVGENGGRMLTVRFVRHRRDENGLAKGAHLRLRTSTPSD